MSDRFPPVRAVLALAALLVALALPGAGPAQTAGDETAPAASPAPTATAPDSSSAEAEGTRPDYEAWTKVAERAEQALEAGRASNQALETLRNELVQWREKFATARNENQVRISTLKTQISTLGPAPGDGETEPAVITEQRAALTAQLEELQAPVKAAELAYARASALIGEIDNIVRTRQTDALFSLGPTPLNPAIWPRAADDLMSTFRLAWSGIVSSFSTETQRAELRKNLPMAILLLVVSIVLLLRGRAWVMHGSARIRERAQGPLRGVLGFFLSLGQVAVPLAGIFALVEAFSYAGILGLRAQVIVDQLPIVGTIFFVARWLGNRVFGQPGTQWELLNLPDSTRSEGRFETTTLGLLLGISHLLDKVAAYESYSDATRAVLSFPIVAFAGFLMFRLGQLLRRHSRAELSTEDDGSTFLARTLGFAGLGLMLLGIAGPFAAAVGYTTLSDSFVFPTVITAGLVGGILVLHQLFVNLHAWAFKIDEQQASEALLPVLGSLVMAVLSLPIFALIWGARVTDLTELWTRINEGVQIGGTVISPSDLLTFAIVFGIGFVATRLVQGTLKSTVLPKTKIDVGGQNAIVAGLGYFGIFLAAVIAITSAGIDLSSLAIVAGALSVGIGFGLQNIVSNFVSGIILLIERPISEGDWIEVGGQMGYVRDISVRSTRIETFDRTDVILPNSDLISGVVTNFTRGNLIGRVIVPVGVAYGTDSKRVEKILKEVAENHPLVAITPPPAVYFMGFGADSLDFEIRAILKDVNFVLSVRSEMNHEIARRFAEEGIEIPFAQRDIWLRNPEVLSGGRGSTPAATAVETDPNRARAQLDESDMSDTGARDEGEGDD